MHLFLYSEGRKVVTVSYKALQSTICNNLKTDERVYADLMNLNYVNVMDGENVSISLKVIR